MKVFPLRSQAQTIIGSEHLSKFHSQDKKKKKNMGKDILMGETSI